LAPVYCSPGRKETLINYIRKYLLRYIVFGKFNKRPTLRMLTTGGPYWNPTPWITSATTKQRFKKTLSYNKNPRNIPENSQTNIKSTAIVNLLIIIKTLVTFQKILDQHRRHSNWSPIIYLLSYKSQLETCCISNKSPIVIPLMAINK